MLLFTLIVRYFCIEIYVRMAELFYKDDKNRDFLSACESVRSEHRRHLPVANLVSLAIRKPAKSFYLHPREYVKIIKAGGRYLPGNQIKRELHLEILRRADEIKSRFPNLKPREVARMIEDHEAPRFYISEKRAIYLYYELLKKK